MREMSVFSEVGNCAVQGAPSARGASRGCWYCYVEIPKRKMFMCKCMCMLMYMCRNDVTKCVVVVPAQKRVMYRRIEVGLVFHA